MVRYLVKRIAFFIPSLLVLILLCFTLLEMAPGSPLDHLTSSDDFSTPYFDKKTQYRWETEKGIHLPVFYVSIKPLDKNYPEKLIPSVQWNTDNKFHRWFFGYDEQKGLINGDLGRSLITNRKVTELLFPAFKWSFILVLFSLLLSYLVSIPIGIKLAEKPKAKWTGKIDLLFNILFSLPVFWVAMLLLMCVANPYVLPLLPSSGVGPIGSATNEEWVSAFIHSIPYFILPVITYSYGSVAMVSYTLTTVMQKEMQSDYVRTARAKGVNEKTVVRKHAYRNAILPLITLFSQVFPAVMGGSVIIETIFSIPGMGTVIFNAIGSKDYPVIIGTFFLTGLITMIGFLITDILYSLADPRIRFAKEVDQ